MKPSVFLALYTTVSMRADQDMSEDICSPKYMIQVTFSTIAEGEPIKSWSQAGPFPAD